MHRTKQWVRPDVKLVTLAQARSKIEAALQLMAGDNELADECAELRLLISALDDQLLPKDD